MAAAIFHYTQCFALIYSRFYAIRISREYNIHGLFLYIGVISSIEQIINTNLVIIS